MSQITFRLNTKPTYSERMTDARSELRKIIKQQLCKCLLPFPRGPFSIHSLPPGWCPGIAINVADPTRITHAGTITDDQNAVMGWSRKSYMKNVVKRHLVRIEGWPLNEVPFRNLSDVSNLTKLEQLLRGFKDGSIRFSTITEEQCEEMAANPSPWIGPEPNPDGGEGEGDAE